MIQKIAATLRTYLQRQNDLVFRLGGEEFGGLVISRNPQETAEWLAGLGQAVEELDLIHSPEIDAPLVTISGGVCFCYPDQLHQCDIDTIYKLADQALYQAKRNGRNRFEVAGFTRLEQPA